MDDNTKIVNQNANQVIPGDQAQPQAQVQPAVPVGSVNKEVGPIGSSVSEFVKPSESEPAISKELKDIGVEAKNDRPDLTNKHKGLVHHAGPHVPIPSGSLGKVTLPMSEDEIASQLKSGQDDDSKKGLAKLLDKVIKALGL